MARPTTSISPVRAGSAGPTAATPGDRGSIAAVVRALAGLLVAAFAVTVQAQAGSDYPTRSVLMIVPFPPGGGTDSSARLVAQKLSEAWKQQVVVENRGGAAGIVGVELVARARPDGYTLLVGNVGTQAINTSLYRKLSYDSQRDFEPISLISELPIVLMATPSLPVKSVSELVALAKAEPGKYTAASSGIGNSTHLPLEIFQAAAGVRFTHVPYKGGSQAAADVMAGHAHIQFDSVLGSTTRIGSGKVKALAVASKARAAALPNVPTMAEAGIADAEMGSWVGLLAPKGTPAAVVDRIAADVRTAVSRADLQAIFTEQGAAPRSTTPAEFGRIIGEDTRRFAELIKRLGIAME
jgi:tripartite-type tricarboxylate transporter receptor subunit TctC